MSLPKESSLTACALLAGIVVLTACGSESLPPVPQAHLSLKDGVSRAESLSFKGKPSMSSGAGPQVLLTEGFCSIRYGEPGQITGCTAPIPIVVPSSPWLQHSGGVYEPAQTDPIKIRFLGEVHGITMQSDGALKCSGPSIGAMVGYRNGAQVVQAANWLTNPADCGSDDVTFGVSGQFPLDVVIDSLVIQGVDPWTFSVFGLEGRARLDYTVTFTPGPGISVSCSPASVVRGGQVTCTASAPSGASSVTVSEWRFESTLLSSTITQQTSDTFWTGPAAASGQVIVTGTIDGNPDNGGDSITVTDRDWTNKTVPHQVVEITPSGLPIHPTRVGELGNTANIAQVVAPTTWVQIPAGPNAGVFYFTDVPVTAQSQIRINRAALSVNSDFYLLQPTNGPAFKCKRADVIPFIPGLEAHEGLGLQPLSHARVFRDTLNAHVPQTTEPVVAQGDFVNLWNQGQIAAQSAIDLASLRAQDKPPYGNGIVPPVPYPCTFKYYAP